MKVTKKEYFVEVEQDAVTGKRLEERWMDEHGRLVEFVEYNYNEAEYAVARTKFDPETGLRHADGEPASTLTCMLSGVVFKEEYFQQGEYHRDDGDAYIFRNRRTGADENRVRWIRGVQYNITPSGFEPVL